MTTPCPKCVETIADAMKGYSCPQSSAAYIRARFLPKSPAQRLAEECPHSMTEEQAQWVLDQRAERDEALAGYRAAVAFISADSWDGCSDCIEVLKAARAADWNNEMAGNSDAVAEHLKRIRKHYTNPVEATPTDTASCGITSPDSLFLMED